MRVLIISDIHANYTALEAVLKDAGSVDAVWCLGDLVGYGPDPNLVIETIRELPNLVCLKGNHDMAVSQETNLEAFNGDARRSLAWHARVLTADNIEFLRALPQDKVVLGEATLAHGSPRDPLWEYILNTLTARMNFEFFETPFCFVGHAHIQSLYFWDEEQYRVIPLPPRLGEAMPLKGRFILNPGSVGQPRDRDPRAAYALFDPEARTWETRRVAYDVAEVQERIRKLGLPAKHALRLAEGW